MPAYSTPYTPIDTHIRPQKVLASLTRRFSFVNASCESFACRKAPAVLNLNRYKTTIARRRAFLYVYSTPLAPRCQRKAGAFMVYGVIYLIWNLVTGMRYVGQTKKSVKQRFKEHARKDSHLGRAIKKYGVENFKFGVIKSCATAEELNYWEKHFIAVLKSKSPMGYNHTDGGDSGWIHTPESIEKIKAANRTRKQKKRSEETLQRMRVANKLSAERYWAKVRAGEIERHAVYLPRERIWKDVYPVLEAELQKKQVTTSKLVEILGLSDTEICRKMRGERNFTFVQMEKVRDFLGVDMPLEELFRRADGSFSIWMFKPYVYPVLAEELHRQEITLKKLGEAVGLAPANISGKIHGKSKFKPAQMTAIRDFLGVTMSVAELFRRA